MAVQISGNDITVPRDTTVTRNLTVGGVLTYEDVTNVDSVCLVTARSGIEIGARPGVAASISVDGNMIISGISTFGGDIQVPDKIIHSGDTDTAIRFPATNYVSIESAGVEKVEFRPSEVTFNDTGMDCDFRIEGDSNANLFKVDAGNDRIGVGLAAPQQVFHVYHASDNGLALFESGDANCRIDLKDNSGQASVEAIGDVLRFGTSSSNTERLRIDSSGRLLLGTTTEGFSGAQTLTIAESGHSGITVRSGATSDGQICFSDATSGSGEYAGQIVYDHTDDFMMFRTNGGNESMRILSNQSICMGGTLQAGANGGLNIESTSSGNKPAGLSLINQGTADDSGFMISYRGKDDAGNQEDYAYLVFTAQDTANGAEDGNLEIWTAGGGSLSKKVQIGPGKANGEPTAFFIMDSNASGASSEACVRLTNLSDTAYNWCTAEFAVNNSVQWKAGAQRHGSGGGADFFLINNGNDRFRIYEGGKIRSPYTYSGTTTGGGPIYVESDGDFLRYTSSRKYKTDIETLEDARADKILDCRPVWYRSLSENDIKTPGADKSDWGWYGFIAEEVAEIEPRLVNWATKDAGTNPDDGFATVERDPSNYEAEGVRYDNFVPLLVNLVKRQKAEIESLKARLDAAGL